MKPLMSTLALNINKMQSNTFWCEKVSTAKDECEQNLTKTAEGRARMLLHHIRQRWDGLAKAATATLQSSACYPARVPRSIYYSSSPDPLKILVLLTTVAAYGGVKTTALSYSITIESRGITNAINKLGQCGCIQQPATNLRWVVVADFYVVTWW